jgi:hypothetical protein
MDEPDFSCSSCHTTMKKVVLGRKGDAQRSWLRYSLEGVQFMQDQTIAQWTKRTSFFFQSDVKLWGVFDYVGDNCVVEFTARHSFVNKRTVDTRTVTERKVWVLQFHLIAVDRENLTSLVNDSRSRRVSPWCTTRILVLSKEVLFY